MQELAPETRGLPPPDGIREVFQHNYRAIEKIESLFGTAGVENHRDNMERTTLVSLFSGLGGAELMVMNSYIASEFKCKQLGLRSPKLPRFLDILIINCFFCGWLETPYTLRFQRKVFLFFSVHCSFCSVVWNLKTDRVS